MLELQGKVALVTGAASGIGLACVKELLRNKLKAVALIDIHEENGQRALAEIRKEFGRHTAIFVKADVGDRTQFEDAFKTTVRAFNQLDIVINNAGIVQELQWEKCIAVNITGVITGTMLAIEKYFPKYKSESEPVVLNTASTTAVQPFDAIPIYSATKSAVVNFTRRIGSDIRYQKTGVRVITICPGLVETPIQNITEEQIAEPYLSMMLTAIKNMTDRQKPEELAKKAIEVIRTAPTGSVWIAQGDTCIQHSLSQ